MNREFLINILFLVTINLLIKPLFIFGIDRNVQNLVGEKAYGVYFSLMSFTIMFQIINDLGVQNFNSREISQNRQLLDKYFSNILVLKTCLGLFYIVSIALMAVVFQYDINLFPLIFSLAINQILFSLLGYLRSNVAGLGYYRTNSILTILDKLMLIVVCSILLWIEPFRSNFNIEWFVHAQNLTLFITCCIAFFTVYKKVKLFKIRFHKPFLLSILRGSLPYALAIFLMTIYTRTDVVMLERLLPDGDRQAGIYASAYRLLDAVNMLGFLFAGLLLPMFSRILKSGESISPLLRFSFQIIMVAALTLAVGVWFHRTDIMHLLYHEATAFSGEVLGYLMFSFVAISGTYIYSTLLGANGSVSKMNGVFITAIIVNILLNFILIPSQKALGAALSTLITQFFVLSGVILLAKKELLLRGDIVWISKIISFVILTFLINYLIKSSNFIPNWVFQLIISMFLCLVAALALGFLNYKKVENLLKTP
jgi:O-antigen/teichoic acid export membrane protein